jgi:hypothetical protein
MATLKQIGSLLERSFEKWDYQKAIKFSTNESETRDYLIERFFEELGYNKMEHYSHEFSLHIDKGKVKKVDMVVTLKKKTIMLIECKKATEKLNKRHYNQLAEYFEKHKESKVGVLTNGIQYEFYSIKWSEEDVLNDVPFLVFDLNDFTRADLEDIALFHRQYFDVNKILSLAEDKYFLDDFNRALVKTLYPASPEFRKIIFQNMLDEKSKNKRMTEQVSDRIFKLINSISLQDAVEKVKVAEGKDSDSGVYTTSKELKAFQIIKTIIALTPKLKNEVDRVSYKDYKGQFKIIVDNMPSKEICHLVLNERTQKIEFENDSFELMKVSAEEIAKHKKRIVDSATLHLIG